MAVEEQAPEAVGDTAGEQARPAGLVRRTVLGGLFGAAVGGGGYLVTAGVLPGRTPAYRALGLDGDDGLLPRVTPGKVHVGAFTSVARRGAGTGYVVALPPGETLETLKTPGRERLPVCVMLHGRGDNARSLVEVGYDRYLSLAVTRGIPPFAIAAVDGGDRYWHPRREGDDSGRMVVDEFLPGLARLGLRAEPRDRIAFLGYSMGGYGALLLAGLLTPSRVAAVVAESPALWTSPDDVHPGAFDDDEDYRRNDVFGRRAQLSGIPLRIDCGLADPFYRAAKTYAEGFDPLPAGEFGRGDHDYGYWRRLALPSLEFIGQALASS